MTFWSNSDSAQWLNANILCITHRPILLYNHVQTKMALFFCILPAFSHVKIKIVGKVEKVVAVLR